ncbi:MAG: hypothetical protein ACKVOQ_01445 [Cyclobacteriaceae bacterium]
MAASLLCLPRQGCGKAKEGRAIRSYSSPGHTHPRCGVYPAFFAGGYPLLSLADASTKLQSVLLSTHWHSFSRQYYRLPPIGKIFDNKKSTRLKSQVPTWASHNQRI